MLKTLAAVVLMGLATGAVGHGLTSAQLDAMRAADIVVLGEIHDNAAHHQGQAELMHLLDPKAVVFEMLTPDMAARVNGRDRQGDTAALGDLIGWEAAGWPDYDIYKPVFDALGQAQVIGAAAPREQVRAAFARGAAAVFGPDADRFGLADALPPDQLEQRREMQFAAHCGAMPRDMMDGMIEAQRLRDAQFAEAALGALETHGAPVVVITGNGHARRDWGIPQMIARAAADVAVFSVGFVERPARAVDPRFDVTIPTDPALRGDPCAAFKQTSGDN